MFPAGDLGKGGHWVLGIRDTKKTNSRRVEKAERNNPNLRNTWVIP